MFKQLCLALRFILILGMGLLVLLGTGGCNKTNENLNADSTHSIPHDAYIWQRVWTPALAQAMQSAAPAIRQWRVLEASYT